MQAAYPAAWRHLHLANTLQHTAQPYSSEQDTQLVAALRSAFPAPKRQQPSPLRPDPYAALLAGQAGHDSKVPVFVVGMPRSGSTLVEQILASHSMVFGAGACWLVVG